jgi:ABC-type enterochelin transport system permease subunit
VSDVQEMSIVFVCGLIGAAVFIWLMVQFDDWRNDRR